MPFPNQMMPGMPPAPPGNAKPKGFAANAGGFPPKKGKKKGKPAPKDKGRPRGIVGGLPSFAKK